jgi:hypothetical protein
MPSSDPAEATAVLFQSRLKVFPGMMASERPIRSEREFRVTAIVDAVDWEADAIGEGEALVDVDGAVAGVEGFFVPPFVVTVIFDSQETQKVTLMNPASRFAKSDFELNTII